MTGSTFLRPLTDAERERTERPGANWRAALSALAESVARGLVPGIDPRQIAARFADPYGQLLEPAPRDFHAARVARRAIAGRDVLDLSGERLDRIRQEAADRRWREIRARLARTFGLAMEEPAA